MKRRLATLRTSTLCGSFSRCSAAILAAAPARAVRARHGRRGRGRRRERGPRRDPDPGAGRQRRGRRRGRGLRPRRDVAGGRQHRRRRVLDLARREGHRDVDRLPRGGPARGPPRPLHRPAQGGGAAPSSEEGPLASGVPGSVAGLALAHRRTGRLPWKRVVDPAVRLARDGFVMTEPVSASIAGEAKRLAEDPAAARDLSAGRRSRRRSARSSSSPSSRAPSRRSGTARMTASIEAEWPGRSKTIRNARAD